MGIVGVRGCLVVEFVRSLAQSFTCSLVRSFVRSLAHLPTIFNSTHRMGGNVTHVNAIAIHAPMSPPYPPTSVATGPAYQAWYMPTMAPAQPIRKATRAATPSGRRARSSQAVQSKGTPRSLRNRRCSSSMMVRKMETQ